MVHIEKKPQHLKKNSLRQVNLLSLDFPVYKMRVIIIPTSQDCVIIKIK